MSKKTNYKAFVNAVRARGGAKHYLLGGNIDLSQGPPAAGAPAGGPLTQGGLFGALTSQSQYQAQLAPTTQLNYTPLVNAGADNVLAQNDQYAQNLANQQALEQQFLAQSQGAGPNPAQAQLVQNTANNVQQQAALAAGQRGGAANSGLIARQAGMAGANAQQQGVGQAATLEAQQRLDAAKNAASQQANIGNSITGNQQVNSGLLNSGISGNNAQNSTNVANYGQVNQTNAATANANAENTGDTGGGLIGGVGTALGGLGSIGKGIGKIFGLAEGGMIDSSESSFVHNFLKEHGGKSMDSAIEQMPPETVMKAEGGEIFKLDKGGSVPAMLSPGEKVVSPQDAKSAAKGHIKAKTVPGSASVKGDSLKNDTAPAMLPEGAIVIPRRITQGPDAANKSAQFVNAVLAKKRSRGR